MASNRKQHIVSQFAIRQFLDESGVLFCLDKQTGKVHDRKHGAVPSKILRENYYYTTDSDDFDAEVVKPLEDRLGPICQARCQPGAADQPVSRDEQIALVEWCSLAIARSLFFARLADHIIKTASEQERAVLPDDTKGRILVLRRATYDTILKRMRSTSLQIRFLKTPKNHQFFLTDHPPLVIPFDRVNEIGPVLLPLGHSLMVAVVPLATADSFYSRLRPTAGLLTIYQVGWAERLIYSSSLESLDFAQAVLDTDWGSATAEMIQRARRPYFGFTDPAELETSLALESAGGPND